MPGKFKRLPRLEGLIARRVLLNYRADPTVVERLIPAPLEVVRRNGSAVVGVCLIRIEGLRPLGVPAVFGLSSESQAHRVAIRYPTTDGPKEGVFVWRRDTNSRATQLTGGRLFPGVHGPARFQVLDDGRELRMRTFTANTAADIAFEARSFDAFRPTRLFNSVAEASAFFQQGECGLSCSHAGRIEGVRLHIADWSITPLGVDSVHASFFEDSDNFPRGSVEFDCGLLMRGVRHEWSEWVPGAFHAMNKLGDTNAKIA